MSNDDVGSYEVGYKKPPKNSRFKKGKSGNTKGRPKKSNDFFDVFTSTLNREISVTGRNGNKLNMTVLESIVLQLVNKAANGDRQSAKLIIEMLKQLDLIKPEKSWRGGVLVVPRPLTKEEYEEVYLDKERKERLKNMRDSQGY